MEGKIYSNEAKMTLFDDELIVSSKESDSLFLEYFSPSGFFSAEVSLEGAGSIVQVQPMVSFDGITFYIPQDKGHLQFLISEILVQRYTPVPYLILRIEHLLDHLHLSGNTLSNILWELLWPKESQVAILYQSLKRSIIPFLDLL